MSEDFDLIVRVKALVDDAIGKLDRLEDQVEKTGGRFDTMKVAAGQAAGMLINQVSNAAAASFGEAVQLGAGIESLRASFEALQVDAGDQAISLEELQEAFRGTVSETDALAAVNSALLLGIDPGLILEMADASVALGAAVGGDTLFAFESLTTGVGRQSKLMLDNVGIILDMDAAYQKMADSLGISVIELDDTQKSMAFTIATQEAMAASAAVLEGTVSDATLSSQQFSASMENLKTNAGAALAPLASFTPLLQGMLPVIGTMTAQALPGLISSIGGVSGALTILSGPIGIALAAVVALAVAWDANFLGIRDATASAVEFITNVMGGIGRAFEGIMSFLDAARDAWSNFWAGAAEDAGAAADEVVDATEKMEHGESPGGIRDVVDSVGDLEAAMFDAQAAAAPLATAAPPFSVGAAGAVGAGGVSVGEVSIVIESAVIDPENMDAFFEDFMLRFNQELQNQGGGGVG